MQQHWIHCLQHPAARYAAAALALGTVAAGCASPQLASRADCDFASARLLQKAFAYTRLLPERQHRSRRASGTLAGAARFLFVASEWLGFVDATCAPLKRSVLAKRARPSYFAAAGAARGCASNATGLGAKSGADPAQGAAFSIRTKSGALDVRPFCACCDARCACRARMRSSAARFTRTPQSAGRGAMPV